MPPLRPRYSRIKAIVEDILSKSHVAEAPVPIDDIVVKRGINLQRGRLGEVSGMIVRRDGGTAIIGVNGSEPVTRQRFTVAHEFGHFLLHEGTAWYDKQFKMNLRSERSSQAIDVEEIEANFFAASILMPEQFLERDVQGHVLDLENAKVVKSLASKYRVSEQAMNLRLINVFGYVGA